MKSLNFLIVVLTSITFSWNAYSMSIAAELKPFSKPSMATFRGCSNFSGDWKGKCTVSWPDGKVHESPRNIVLKQTDCDHLERNGEHYFLDGSKTTSSTTGNENLSSITHPSWNADRTQIISNFSQVGKITYPGGSTQVHNLDSISTARLDGGNLIYVEDALERNLNPQTGQVKQVNIKIQCTLQK